MYFALLLTLISIIGSFKTSIADEDWDYKNTDNWKSQFPTCGGEKQSPIDFNTKKILDRVFLNLTWNNYDKKPKLIKLVNNGHTVQLKTEWNDGDEIPSITSNIFQGEYVFAEAHFHWGPNDNSGSEHTFNGKTYPLEFQLLHYKKDYSSLDDAVKNQDGVVIVTSVAQISNNEESKKSSLHKITPFINNFTEIGSFVDISETFPLSSSKLINAKWGWISYNGSLTIPKCSETVPWIVSLHLFGIPKDQLEILRKVKLLNGDDHNNRPTQPINGRKVYYHRD